MLEKCYVNGCKEYSQMILKIANHSYHFCSYHFKGARKIAREAEKELLQFHHQLEDKLTGQPLKESERING